MIALALEILTVWLLSGLALGLIVGPVLKHRSALYPPVLDGDA